MKTTAYIIGILMLLLIVLIYPVELPYSLNMIGKILPVREMKVNHDASGRLSAVLYNHINGIKESTFSAEFQRGDAVRFIMHSSIVPGTKVEPGDTLGRIDSREIERQLIQLNGELNIQNATLSLAMSGEKESIIEEHRKNLESAVEEFEEQKIIVERLKNLYEVGYFAYQDYELARNRLNLLKIAVDQAKAGIRTVETGVREEEIDLISTRILGIEREIEALHELYSRYIIVSPISGIVLDVITNNDINTIIHIADTSRYYVVIPIKLKESMKLEIGKEMIVTVDGISGPFHGKIVNIRNVVRVLLNGEQVIFITGELEKVSGKLPVGAMVKCSIILGQLKLREHIKRFILGAFSQ